MTQTHRLALPAGTRLRDYEVLGVLGQGGFGITYLGLNTALDQRVAIKEYLPGAFAMRDGNTLSVQPNGADSEQVFHWGLQRFLEEARILARLSHPNIVRVLYFMSLNDTGYMVMEFLEGKTLGAWLKEREPAPITQDDVLRILDPLTDALALVHDNGLAHRDIKPDNVFMRQGTTPVLIDFGAARNVFTGRSETVAAIVTPGYSPNEQYSGTVNQGPWTDIYTMGAVVYRMVVGDAPADAPSRIAHLMEGRPDPCLRFAEVAGPRFDASFVRAVDWAMRLRADERPQSVREWRQALGLGQRFASAPTAADPPATARTEPRPSSGLWPPTAPHEGPAAASQVWSGAAPAASAPLPLSLPVKAGPLAWMIAAGLGAALVAGAALLWWPQREGDRIGDSLAQAFPLGTLGAQPLSVSDSIGGGDPVDVVRFELAADSEVSLRLDGPGGGASLRLTDADARPVPLFGDGANRLAELRRGSYALEIASQSSHSQRYTLQLQGLPLSARARPGAEPKTALDLAGRGAFDGEAVLYQGRIWPGPGEQFFKLSLDHPARVAIAIEAPGASGSLSLTDANGGATATRQIAPDRAEPLIQELAAGRHFIAVGSRSDAPWAYRLKVKVDGLPRLRDVPQASEDEGRSFETAQLLPEPLADPQAFDVRIPEGQRQRYFALRVTRSGTLAATASGDRFEALELFRAGNGDPAARATGQAAISLLTNVEPGPYVLRVAASAGPASGKLAVAMSAKALLGASEEQPVVLGSVGLGGIEHSAALRKDEPENWLAFGLDQGQQIGLELTRADGGPLPKGMVVSLMDRERDRSRAFFTREDGEILSQTMPLEAGRYLLKLRTPEGRSLDYALRLYGIAKIPARPAGGESGLPRRLEAGSGAAATGVVGGKDGAERFRLRADGGAPLTLQLDDLEQNADLVVLAEDGRVLAESRRTDARMEDVRLRGDEGDLTVKVETASPWLTPYRLRLIPQAKAPEPGATAGIEAAAGDTLWQASAGVRLKDGLTRQEALRLAKARARAKLIEAARQGGKAAPEPSEKASAAQLLAAIQDGIPYREKWQARWLGEDQLAVTLQARIQRPRGDDVLTASIPDARVAAGQQIVVSVKAAEALRAGLFAWQADGTVLRLSPRDGEEALSLAAGEKLRATDKVPGGVTSAPMPGAKASEEAIVVLACPGPADFAALAPVPGSTAQSSLTAAIETPAFFEAVTGLCPGKLVVRVLSYRVEDKSG
ncbi:MULTISPECIES: serine/threonine-protein kinase [Rhodomicrobium]|uniref:serine/threonine-protein kinase n=1 Tax=Rhodomicrobium TaxID=1068 RepID=UPI001482689A|nr:MULTISPECIES: serine/threonine-protein kinase [Rhodomicrobium]